jgi:hypothetical protein
MRYETTVGRSDIRPLQPILTINITIFSHNRVPCLASYQNLAPQLQPQLKQSMGVIQTSGLMAQGWWIKDKSRLWRYWEGSRQGQGRRRRSSLPAPDERVRTLSVVVTAQPKDGRRSSREEGGAVDEAAGAAGGARLLWRFIWLAIIMARIRAPLITCRLFCIAFLFAVVKYQGYFWNSNDVCRVGGFTTNSKPIVKIDRNEL